MSMSFRVAAFPMILMTALSACVGGGGGSGERGSVVREVPFTSFSAVGPNETVVMSGVSQTGSGTDSAFNLDPVNETGSTAKLTYDANRNLSGIGISTPRSSVSFGAGETGCTTTGGCAAGNATSQAALVDPAFFGWNYQSFGVWMNHISSTSFQAGALSAGAVTPASALPTGLTDASFTGHASGFYFDAAGNRFATDAQMSAVTDFKNRNIQFSTTGTLLTDTSTFARTDRPTLDLTGNWSYAPGTSQFSGAVDTQDGALTGNASGRFYGPNAQEIGGVYGLTGGGASMLGGFGGKR
jgi:hypothetical protein